MAKRLECLGALTHGDRRAAETRDLSRFNIDNKYGKQAVENVIRSICNVERAWAPFPRLINNDMRLDFVSEARKALVHVGLISRVPNGQQIIYIPEKGTSAPSLLYSTHLSIRLFEDFNNMSRFLNRILGIHVHMQNLLFRFFSDVLNAVIVDARRSGSWDLGILGRRESIQREGTRRDVLS